VLVEHRHAVVDVAEEFLVAAQLRELALGRFPLQPLGLDAAGIAQGHRRRARDRAEEATSRGAKPPRDRERTKSTPATVPSQAIGTTAIALIFWTANRWRTGSAPDAPGRRR